MKAGKNKFNRNQNIRQHVAASAEDLNLISIELIWPKSPGILPFSSQPKVHTKILIFPKVGRNGNFLLDLGTNYPFHQIPHHILLSTGPTKESKEIVTPSVYSPFAILILKEHFLIWTPTFFNFVTYILKFEQTYFSTQKNVIFVICANPFRKSVE